MITILITLAGVIWIWMAYTCWRDFTQDEEYLHLSSFIALILFIGAAPFVFLVCIAESPEIRSKMNPIICKRWLSKQEKIGKVKEKMN